MDETQRYLEAHRTVTKSNEIVTNATYDLTAEEQKIIAFCISRIKPTDAEFERYTISAAGFAELCGIAPSNVYTAFKRAVEDFDNKARWMQIGDDVVRMRVFSEAEYNEKQGSITVMIHSKLKKYLLDLKKNFTRYELWNVLTIRSKYAIRLYEIFKAGGYKSELQFDIDRLRGLLCAGNYSLYGNLKARVIDPAVKEINEKTDLLVEYDPLRTGKSHKITGIVFKVRKKKKQDAMRMYWKTVEKMDKQAGQVPGQMSFFTTDAELEKIYESTDIKS